jgi:transposase InsO family protein
MKYQFIAESQQEYPITTMCHVLEVSVSGYYAWCKRAPSLHSREDAHLAEKVKTAFQDNRCVYGSPRVHAELHAQGLHCARKRVARLMREQGLFAKRPGHRTVTTKSEPGAQRLPICSSATSAPMSPTANGWQIRGTFGQQKGGSFLPLCLICSRVRRVGWSMATIQDATLVVQALCMALARRCPQAGLLHHSDRGSTYTSESYQGLLEQEGMQVSMSRTADCYDNAAMESFFHSFKGECIDCQSFQTRSQARSITFDYIECFYNRTRRHSTLHYLSPLAYEQSMC